MLNMAKTLLSILALLALSTLAVAQQQPAARAPAGDVATGGVAGTVGLVSGINPQRGLRPNPVTSIQEFVRIEGYSRSPLRGIGIVTGLNGTGDSGAELALARPLAEVYKNNGIPLADLKELGKARHAALVTISCEIPEGGGRYGDTYDVYVQAMHSAKSLKGGTLILSPLMGPNTRDPVVFAMASGPIVLEDTEVPTTGRIRDGVQLLRDIRARPVGDQFNLILRPHFRSFSVARTLASEINGITADLENDAEGGDGMAEATDEMTIRVTVPAHERANPSNFLARLMTKRFSPSLVDLPAMVVVNERTGSIIVTGDVEIAAVTVGNDKLLVSTGGSTPQGGDGGGGGWTEFGSTATNGERARIQDLLEAFRRLNVPTRKQIEVLAQVNQTGRLHAKFISEK